MPLIQHSAFGPQPIRYAVTHLPDDPDGQVEVTIDLMRRYAKEDAGSPEIQRAIGQAVSSHPNLSPIEAIFRWAKSHTTFKNDIDIVSPIANGLQGVGNNPIIETLVRPRDLVVMSTPTEDCDGHSMLGASMLMGLGVPPSDIWFVTVAADPADPTQFSHVYLAVVVDGGVRVPLDISHGKQIGWEVPQDKVYRKQEWNLNKVGESLIWLGLAALGAYKIMSRSKRAA